LAAARTFDARLVKALSSAAVIQQECPGCWQFATVLVAEMAEILAAGQILERTNEEILEGQSTHFPGQKNRENSEK
jgi:hypothetical protein